MEREQLQQHLVDLLYDELPEGLKSEVHKALKAHPDCAQDLDEMREMHLLAKSVPTLEVPAKVHNDILREARLNAHQKTAKEKTGGSFFVRWLNSPAFASALVVCLVLGVGVLLQRQAQGPGPTVSPEAQSVTLASELSESPENTVAAIGGETEPEDGYRGETSLDQLAPSAHHSVEQQNIETVAQLELEQVTGVPAVSGNGDVLTTPTTTSDNESQPSDDDYWAVAARSVPSGSDAEPVEEEPAYDDENQRLRERRESEDRYSNVDDNDFGEDDEDEGDYHTAWRDDDDDDDGWAEGEADIEVVEISVGYGSNRVYGGQESNDPAFPLIDTPVPQVDIEWPREGDDDGTVSSNQPLQLAVLDDETTSEDEPGEPYGFAPGLAPSTEASEASPDEEGGVGSDTRTRPQTQEYDDGLRRLNDGSYRDAIVHFDNFIQNVPHTSDFLNSALFYQGQAHMELGDYDAAADNFAQIVESPAQFEYHLEAQFLLAQALELNGEYDLAETNYLDLTVFDNDFNELATEGLLRIETQRVQSGEAQTVGSTQLDTASDADEESEEADDATMDASDESLMLLDGAE